MSNKSTTTQPQGTTYSQIVADIRECGLNYNEIAQIVGIQKRQIQHWASGTQRPKQPLVRDRLLETHYLIQQLSKTHTPESVDIWLHARNDRLNGQTPLGLLQQRLFKAILEETKAIN